MYKLHSSHGCMPNRTQIPVQFAPSALEISQELLIKSHVDGASIVLIIGRILPPPDHDAEDCGGQNGHWQHLDRSKNTAFFIKNFTSYVIFIPNFSFAIIMS